MKKFLCGVAKVYAYDVNDNLVFSSKTMLSDAIAITTNKQEVRAGQGNVLQMVYFHTSAMDITLEEQQFDMGMLAKALGSAIVTGNNIFSEETVTVTGGAGSVLGTPIVLPDSGYKYGWVEQSNGLIERVTFSTQSFSGITQQTGDVCVRYYTADSAARYINVNANIIPSVVRLVLDAQLFSGDPSSLSTSTLIGRVQVNVPRAQLDGSANLDLTTTGVSKTPLKAMALATPVAGCSSSGVYATITEIVDSSFWYTNVGMISLVDDTISMTHPSTQTLQVWAIPTNGDAPFIAPNSDLSFSSGTPGTATIGLHTGLITTIASGSSILSIFITNKSSVTTSATLTVTT